MYFIQKYFNLSKRELNGIMVLLVITLGMWCIPVLYDLTAAPESEYYEEIIQNSDLQQGEVIKEAVSYFNFDPNRIDAEEWRKLGLSPSQIKTITNYKTKGGVFHKKGDLKKIYTLSEADYQKLEPYIHIKTTAIKHTAITFKDSTNLPKYGRAHSLNSIKKPTVLDINLVDTLDLMQLPGIGTVYAKRILKYRNLLGGYYLLEQLKEVYGMDSLRFETIKPFLLVDRKHVRQIPINKANYQDLRKHPYINANYAKVIVQYRMQHGAFNNIEDLTNIVLFDKDYLRKIEPYLNFSND